MTDRQKNPPRSLALLVLAAMLVAGCGRSAGGATADGELSGKLVITGSSTLAPLVAELAKRFEQHHPRVRIDVQTGGSSRGIADARAGLADIGMVSRALVDEEGDLEAIPIARDGVGLIVHANNPIASLTEAQVRDIFLGRVDSWIAVGGDDASITVVTKADGRATLEVFAEYFDLEPAEIAADIVIGDNQQGIKTVSADPFAIGFVSIGAADWEIRHGAPLRLLTVGSATPSIGGVASGDYPVSRHLNLVITGPAQPLANAFLDFALSRDAHDLIESQLFVPISG